MFEETRSAFLQQTGSIAISHRTVRLRALQRLVDKAEEQGNFPLVAQLLRQAAEEMGSVDTNRRARTDPARASARVEIVAPDERAA